VPRPAPTCIRRNGAGPAGTSTFFNGIGATEASQEWRNVVVLEDRGAPSRRICRSACRWSFGSSGRRHILDSHFSTAASSGSRTRLEGWRTRYRSAWCYSATAYAQARNRERILKRYVRAALFHKLRLGIIDKAFVESLRYGATREPTWPNWTWRRSSQATRQRFAAGACRRRTRTGSGPWWSRKALDRLHVASAPFGGRLRAIRSSVRLVAATRQRRCSKSRVSAVSVGAW
jgi:hypothetical protein